MDTTTMPETFDQWLQQTLDEDQLQEIVEHGASAGFPGLTYYSDTFGLYVRYEDEIWQALREDAKDFDYRHPLDFIASFNGAKDVANDTAFCNLLVWYMAERTAARLF